MNCTIRCCQNCTERQVGCHSICERYNEQKAEWEAKRLAEQEEKRKERVSMQAIVAARMRMAKGRKNGKK